jgi:DNA-directed RNA polymerase specialized sigma24 family protein
VAAHPHPPAEPRPTFDSWVEARVAALTRFALVLTGSADDAGWLVQRALASAYLQWRRSSEDGLEELAQGLVVRAYLRRGGRTGRGPVDPGNAGEWPEDTVLGEDLVGTEAGAARSRPPAGMPGEPSRASTLVWRRCERLGRRQRAVLVLHCYQGLRVPEAAAMVRCRRRTAAADLASALAVVAPARRARDAWPETPHEQAARVRRALLEYAETAPPAYASTDRAVLDARRLRRRRLVTVAAAGAALVLPAAVALAPGDRVPDRDEPGVLRPPPALDVGGWRWESWGGVQVQVPPEWGHGDLTQWCVSRGPDGPAVDRPELVSTDALCSLHDDGRPTYTGGLLLRRAESSPRLSRADVAPYASTRIYTLGGVTLTVVDIDPAVGSAILASAEVIGRRDNNGCRPHQQVRGAGFLADGPTAALRSGLGPADTVSVCRYGLRGWAGPTLISSRRLAGRTADDLVEALRAAPRVVGPSRTRHCRGAEREFAVLELWPADDGGAPALAPASLLVRYDGCRSHGLYDGLEVRRLTSRVLQPILVPPWSGGLSADVRRALARR